MAWDDEAPAVDEEFPHVNRAARLVGGGRQQDGPILSRGVPLQTKRSLRLVRSPLYTAGHDGTPHISLGAGADKATMTDSVENFPLR